MVRLSGHAARKPAQLSGGQQQRVALARALVGRPKVLLLDEPLGALDLKLREQMQVELKAIQREVGITFVIVTHDQDEALTLCDRLAVFNDGRIEQVGAARDVYEHPANRFVADFVGTSNVLDGRRRRSACSAGPARSRSARNASWSSPGQPAPAGMRSVDATVAEVVYAGPITRIAARRPGGCRTDRHAAQRRGLRRPRPRRTSRSWPGRTVPVRDLNHQTPRSPPVRLQDLPTAARIGMSLVACALVVARLFEFHRVRRRQRGRRRRHSAEDEHPRRRSATARASSTSSPGPATPRTAPTTRRSTG